MEPEDLIESLRELAQDRNPLEALIALERVAGHLEVLIDNTRAEAERMTEPARERASRRCSSALSSHQPSPINPQLSTAQ